MKREKQKGEIEKSERRRKKEKRGGEVLSFHISFPYHCSLSPLCNFPLSPTG